MYAAPQAFGATPGAALQPGGGKPRVRNALMTMLLPAIISVGGVIAGVIVIILGGVAESAVIALLGTLLYLVGALAGGVLGLISAIKMIGELNAVTRSPRGIVVYIFLWLYALAADLNDIAKAMP
jgi:hypothetical protein